MKEIIISKEWKCKRCGYHFLSHVEHPCPNCDKENFEKWMAYFHKDKSNIREDDVSSKPTLASEDQDQKKSLDNQEKNDNKESI